MNYIFAFFVLGLNILVLHTSLIANTLLWNNDLIQVFEENSLIKVSPNEMVYHISDVPEDTFIAMEKTIGKMESVFEEAFGLGDYVRSMPLHDTAGIQATLFPVKAFQEADGIDLEIKVRILLQQFCDSKNFLPPLSHSAIAKIAAAAQKILSENSNPPPIPLPAEVLSYVHVKEAFSLLKGTLIDFGENIPFELELEEQRSHFIPPSACVFCRDEVLKKQSIYKSKQNEILINFSPYVHKTNQHFLIIPNHHISKISEQTDGEIKDFYQLAIRLDHLASTHFNIMENSREVGIIITRNGWFGGQTVPHLHHHCIFFIPNTPQRWMHDLLFSLSNEKWESKKTSPEEFESMRAEFAKFF